MSRTMRKARIDSLNPPRDDLRDGEFQNYDKNKKPKKSFVYRGDGWATKARGGPGNKAGWKNWMPRWIYKKLKNKVL